MPDIASCDANKAEAIILWVIYSFGNPAISKEH